MTIHHATKAKAAALGYTIIETALPSGETEFVATSERATVTTPAAPLCIAMLQAFDKACLPAEYPFVMLDHYSPPISIPAGLPSTTLFMGAATSDEADVILSMDSTDVEAVWAAFAEEYADEINDAAEADEGEDERSGSIVRRKYRDEYKVRGDETRCCDMICSIIDPITRVQNDKGKMVADLDSTRILAQANGIEKSWPHLNNGQQAMNWRNMIRNKVRKSGELILPAELTGKDHDEVLEFNV